MSSPTSSRVVAAAPHDSAHNPVQAPVRATPADRGLVMVVDDDRSIRDLVAFALEDEGYRVAAARDGADAVALLERGVRPRVILLDMRMPVMDGWEFAAVCRARRLSDAPIVVMTAAQSAEGWAREVGAAGYLAKPFGLDDLMDCVARHCAS